jgi:hypothetical protein
MRCWTLAFRIWYKVSVPLLQYHRKKFVENFADFAKFVSAVPRNLKRMGVSLFAGCFEGEDKDGGHAR